MPGNERLESLSPFCMKLELYLKLRQLPYKITMGDPRKATKSKLPFIEGESDGSIADSSIILAHLEAKAAAPLDAYLARIRGRLERAREA